MRSYCALILILFSSCTNKPGECPKYQRTKNTLMTEHDKCKVFKFVSYDEWCSKIGEGYFTTCRGEVGWEVKTMQGKIETTEQLHNPTGVINENTSLDSQWGKGVTPVDPQVQKE